MKKILNIHDQDIFANATSQQEQNYWSRQAARAVLKDAEGRVALLHVTAHGYYKLPGGGIEEGESVAIGLERECLEETGCKITIGKEIGIIEEYRDKEKMHQTSFCYFAEVVGEKGKTSFVGDEITDGFELVWVSFDEALELVKMSKPANYEGAFIRLRDLTFLQEAKNASG